MRASNAFQAIRLREAARSFERRPSPPKGVEGEYRFAAAMAETGDL